MKTTISKICSECNGEGEWSECCHAEVDYHNKCESCGKFSSIDECDHCWGAGVIYFQVGEEISIYVYNGSNQKLKNLFPNGHWKTKGKDYNGIITKILEHNEIEVKLNNNRKIIIDVQYIDFY